MMIRIRLLRARLALQSETLTMLFAYGSVGLWVIFWFGD
jgi:hypothetical protein